MTESANSAVHTLNSNPLKFWRKSVVLTLLVSTALLIVVELLYWTLASHRLHDGMYFEATSSDEMVQTIELRQLAESPLKIFWYLHFQPPGFDFVRLVLAYPEWVSSGTTSVVAVDVRLYLLNAILFGAINAMIFYWGRIVSGSVVIPLLALIVWSLYPGNLFIATFLDSMYLSTFSLVLTTHFWFLAIRTSKQRWFIASGVMLIVAALIRTSLQPVVIPAIVALAIAIIIRLGLVKDARRLLKIGSLLCLVALVLPAKQIVLYSTPASSTVSGHHLLGLIRHLPSIEDENAITVPRRILENGKVFENKFNNVRELERNYRYSRVFVKEILDRPLLALRNAAISTQRSIVKGAGATHHFQYNLLTGDLPWSDFAALLFSGLSYLALIVFGFLGLVISFQEKLKSTWRHGVLIVLPPLTALSVVAMTIFLGSMRYTQDPEVGQPFGWFDGFSSTETDRLKFLLEPFVLPTAVVGIAMSVAQSVKVLKHRYPSRFRRLRWGSRG